jgi:predicted nucleic acid-binding Zn ribbon protein
MDEDSWNDEEEATFPCPYCKHPIHEESQRCPHCGNYISEEDAPPARKPWWIIVGALLVLYVVYRWMAG